MLNMEGFLKCIFINWHVLTEITLNFERFSFKFIAQTSVKYLLFDILTFSESAIFFFLVFQKVFYFETHAFVKLIFIKWIFFFKWCIILDDYYIMFVISVIL